MLGVSKKPPHARRVQNHRRSVICAGHHRGTRTLRRNIAANTCVSIYRGRFHVGRLIPAGTPVSTPGNRCLGIARVRAGSAALPFVPESPPTGENSATIACLPESYGNSSSKTFPWPSAGNQQVARTPCQDAYSESSVWGSFSHLRAARRRRRRPRRALECRPCRFKL
jgi:hypothetical protein